VVRFRSGEFSLGFEGTPSHTHGDILAAESGLAADEAVRAYVQKLIGNKLTIAVSTIGGKIRDIWIPDDPAQDLRYCPPDENIEFRLWRGTKIVP
jgi:hypothetical protein